MGLDTLRAEIEPTVFTADQQEETEALGNQYNAEMVNWGKDTGGRFWSTSATLSNRILTLPT